MSRTRVWDWTLRAVHWSWAFLLIAMWWTAEQNHMIWHKWLGLVFIGLLTYRLVWGLIGPSTARLAPLIINLKLIPRYILGWTRQSRPDVFGHNPLGGLSVLAMLLLMTFQVVTGLISVDVDGLASGWFGHLVSFEFGREASDLHEIGFNLLLLLISMHLLAIAAYQFWLKINLLAPMLTGWQSTPGNINNKNSVETDVAQIGTALTTALVMIGIVIWLGR